MSIDGDSLICPITQEVFRDPVIAEDGRLYEREAITRWINEHGTSPFTRQILDVNYLQSDDFVRKKADQRRRLSVSYNRESDQVQLPPLRSSANTADHLDNTVITATHAYQPTIVQKPSCWLQKRCQVIFIICLIIVIIIASVAPAIPVLISHNKYHISTRRIYTTTTSPMRCFPFIYKQSEDSCLDSFSTIVSLNAMTCNTFKHHFFYHFFRALPSNVTIIFGFQQTSGFWNIDNITLFDMNTTKNLFSNGDFESGSLLPNYRQCHSIGNISATSRFYGRYSYSDGTQGQYGYLMQKVSFTVRTLYNLSFYLDNRYASRGHFVVLLATGG